MARIFSPEMAFLLLGPIILSTLGTPPHFPHFMDLTGKRIAELCTHSASQKRIKIVPQGNSEYTRYIFLSNHNIHKSSCGLYFWASDPLNHRIW